MFVIVKGSHPKVTYGELDKVIISFNQNSVSIQYHEGWVDDDGKFHSLGVNSITLTDIPEAETKPGALHYSTFMQSYNIAKNKVEHVETWLAKKLS